MRSPGAPTRTEFITYTSECEATGFNLNTQTQDNAFYAENDIGYELIVEYYECDIMYICLDVPEEIAEADDAEEEFGDTSSSQEIESEVEEEPEVTEEAPPSSSEDDVDFTTALEPYEGAIQVCQKIKDALNNPDSLQLHEVLHVINNGCDYYYIDLSGMNKMGGYTRTTYYAMFMDGVLFELEEMESFSYEEIIYSEFDDLEYLDVRTIESSLK